MFLWLTFALSHVYVYSREVDEEILNKLKHFEIEMSILRGSNENLKERLVVLENQNNVLKQDNENRKTENIFLKQELLGMKLKMDAAIASSDAVSTSAVDGQDVFTHNKTHSFPSPSTFTRNRTCGLLISLLRSKDDFVLLLVLGVLNISSINILFAGSYYISNY